MRNQYIPIPESVFIKITCWRHLVAALHERQTEQGVQLVPLGVTGRVTLYNVLVTI